MRGVVEGALSTPPPPLPPARWEEEGEAEERWRKGWERRTRRRTKGEYVCDVCGGHYEEPGVVARQRLSAPTYSHHPQPIPKTPLWDPPSLHGVLFLPFYTTLSLIPHPLVLSSLPLFSATFSKQGLSSISTLILIRWERLDWHYRFRWSLMM